MPDTISLNIQNKTLALTNPTQISRHLQQQQWQQALNAIAQADATTAATFAYAKGICLANLGKFQQAATALSECLKNEPDSAQLHSDLGNCYRLSDQLSAAKDHLQIAVKLDHKHAGAACNLGLLYLGQGQYHLALQQLKQAQQLQPNNIAVADALCEALIKTNDTDQAARLLPAIQQHINGHRVAELQSLLHITLTDFDKARAILRHAIDQSPSPSLLMQLGVLEEQLGNETGAAQALNQLLLQDNHHADAWFRLLHLRSFMPTSQQALLLSQAAGHATTDNATTDASGAKLWFAMAKLANKQKRLNQEIEYLHKAHGLAANYEPFDLLNMTKMLDNLASYQGKAQATKLANGPIFVVGNPRSGTTLVDQILASHPNTLALGESGVIPRLAAQLGWQPGQTIGELVSIDVSRKQAALNWWHQQTNVKAGLRIVDTSPDNLLYVPVIDWLFDDACIVGVRRNLADTALSIYQQGLSKEHSYAHSITALAARVKGCDQLVVQWAEQKIVTPISYEVLVGAANDTIRQLLEGVNLSDCERCYSPQDHQRRVTTPSASQVRQPINRSAIDKASAYKSYLSELFVALAN